MDKRRNYYLVIDTETANTMANENGGLDMSNVLVYDLGMAVVDKQGNVYETKSLVVSDIFKDEKDLMQSAYYSKKIPQYIEDIEQGKRQVVNFYQARKIFHDLYNKWNIQAIVAHNARFDYNALQVTQRFLTKSKYRYFFPKGAEMWDTMKMANDTICKQKSYKDYCQENGYLTKNGQVRKTAEILYRYISGLADFDESHTALEDVLIEKEIMAHCFRQHKPMRKKLFENSTVKPNFQLNRWWASVL